MIRVLIADDHPVVRAGLRQILSSAPDVAVVGEAADGPEVLRKVHATSPQVLLLDITMPDTSFLSLLREVRERHPKTRVLVLSVHPEEQYAVRALRAGAAGYITKERSPELLLEAIRKVVRGGRFLSDTLTERLVSQLDARGTDAPHDALSDREYEVLRRIGAGKTVKEIAGELSISPKTVHTFRSRILKKMGLRTNAELVRYAVEHDLTP